MRIACLFLLFAQRAWAQDETLAQVLTDYLELSETVKILEETGIFEEFLQDENRQFTLLAPTNAALQADERVASYLVGVDEVRPLWLGHLYGVMANHIIADEALTFDDIFDASRTSLDSMRDPILVSQVEGTLSDRDITIVAKDVIATNGVLHIIDGVLPPEFFNNTFRNLELQPEFGPDALEPPRMSLQSVTDFIGARDFFDDFRPNGLTQLGCRIRAFVDRNMGQDYLEQTINDSDTVQEGEFLNETRKDETVEQFLRYSMLPYNFYADSIPRFYQELVTPLNDCGHMWITSKDGKICFNDGCIVQEPNKPRREFLAANG